MKKAQTMMRSLIMGMLAVGVLTFSGCGEDGEDILEIIPTETIAELIESTEGLDSLAKYMDAELLALLQAPGSHTFFAPDNNAFVSLLQTPGFPTDIPTINPDIIKAVLAYHIVAGQELLQADLTPGSEVGTLYSDPTTQANQVIVVNQDGTLLTGATNEAIEIKTADLKATNGVMHVTKSVLIPPSIGSSLTALLGTIAGGVKLGADFSILSAGLDKAEAYAATSDLIPSLLTELTTGNYSFFATTNDTFDANSITADTFTGAEWWGIIAHGMVPTAVTNDAALTADDMTSGAAFSSYLTLAQVTTSQVVSYVGPPTYGFTGVYLDTNNNPYNGEDPEFEAEVYAFNVSPVSNGAIHIIVGVMQP